LKAFLRDWDSVEMVASLLIVGLFGLSPLVIKVPYYLNMIILTALFAYFGLAWNIIGGISGQLLIGFASFVGVGGFVTMVLLIRFSVSPWIGLPISAASSCLLGAFVAFLTLRYGLKVDYLALFSLALMMILKIIAQELDITGRASGMFLSFQKDSLINMTFVGKVPYLYIATGMLLLGVVIQYVTCRSKTGRYLVAIREDEDAAAALGVDTARYKTIALLLGSAMGGLGGGFYAIFSTYLDPALIFGLAFNVSLLIAPIIGGKGTLIGPILGAILNKPLSEWIGGTVSAQRPGVTLVVYGVILMVFILFLPNGIAGLLRVPHERLRVRLRSTERLRNN
jgi:branched-chain amino acid transport system permease protein